MKRPKLMWFDMTTATRHAEVDRIFTNHFDIHQCISPDRPDDYLRSQSCIAACFEFDYPDRRGLTLLRSTKERFPRVPVLMLTTQHSEKLAVWAYRSGVLDYLVRPVTTDELLRCKDRLVAIQSSENRSTARTFISSRSSIPIDIPAVQHNGVERLASAVEFVKGNFHQKIRSAEIAKLCHMSQFHFSREFTERFSLTFQEFVLRYRVFEACKQLRHPRITVASVAFGTGFNDPSYFARVFRRFTNLSPSEYCEQIRGDTSCQFETIIARLGLPDAVLMHLHHDGSERAHERSANLPRA